MQNEQGRTVLNRTWSYYPDLGGFRLASHTEYEHNDLGMTVRTAQLNFFPDSTYSGGTRTTITVDHENLRLTGQLVELMPPGVTTETDWEYFRRVSYDYGPSMMTQREEQWDVDDGWKTLILGYSYYSDPAYPDSSITHQYNPAADALLPLAKLVNVYDVNMLLVESRTYLWDPEQETFVNVGRNENTYNNQGRLVRRLVFGGTGGELFQTQELVYDYDHRNRQIFSQTLNLNMHGEISTGSRQFVYYAGDDWLGHRSYSWNPAEQDWMQSSYYHAARYISERVNQVGSGSYSTWSGWNETRTVTSFDDYPVIVNDGPMDIAVGDTVRFTILSIDTRFDVPQLTISDLPPGATFDPDTREFEWVVTEDLSRAMTVKAVSSKGAFETQVVFRGSDYVTSAENQDERPARISLSQNYPNPFNPSTIIGFELPFTKDIRLEVFDVLGRRVAVLADGLLEAGVHEVTFDASHLSSGVYLYRLTHSEQVLTRQMTLLK